MRSFMPASMRSQRRSGVLRERLARMVVAQRTPWAATRERPGSTVIIVSRGRARAATSRAISRAKSAGRVSQPAP